MDKQQLMESLARELNEKDGFNGAWLYADKGEIVSKGVLGFPPIPKKLPVLPIPTTRRILPMR